MRNFLAIACIMLAQGCDFDPPGALKVGQAVPSIKTKTLQDVGGDFSRITSYRYPDERMYRVSLHDALAQGKPIVLEFATPGHCTVCDRQLQTLKGVLTKYEGQVLFLHMDQYQNPEAFKAFNVMGDPWTYVIDAQGKVSYRQAGSILYQELDGILARLMSNGGPA
ncbi:MAG: thioredoxin family protein [Gammaproteobacteria bacterium]|nr:thioredoxin family protein [Gammaproteobacteria bacterium]